MATPAFREGGRPAYRLRPAALQVLLDTLGVDALEFELPYRIEITPRTSVRRIAGGLRRMIAGRYPEHGITMSHPHAAGCWIQRPNSRSN